MWKNSGQHLRRRRRGLPDCRGRSGTGGAEARWRRGWRSSCLPRRRRWRSSSVPPERSRASQRRARPRRDASHLHASHRGGGDDAPANDDALAGNHAWHARPDHQQQTHANQDHRQPGSRPSPGDAENQPAQFRAASQSRRQQRTASVPRPAHEHGAPPSSSRLGRPAVLAVCLRQRLLLRAVAG